MDNRERILELVSQGVLSVEEGLDLLESLSKQETQKTEEKEFTSDESEAKESTVKTEPKEKDTETEEDTQDVEDDLERLANQINQYSVGIDALNKDLAALKLKQATFEAELAKEEDLKEQKYLENKIERLNEDIKEVIAEKDKRMKDMHSLKMKRWTSKAKQFSGTIDIPKEWREGASETIDKAGEIIDSSSQTIGNLLQEIVKKMKDALDNIDWQDVKKDFTLKEVTTFDHEWLFENTSASILDFKNANGDIEFKPSINENIKVTAKIKIYGKMEEATPLEAFESRSVIHIDEDHFTFHIPSKNIKADLVVYLPQRNYDYIHLNTFNGNIEFNELLASDIYVKVTSGDIVFNQLEASMLEVKATNGDVNLSDIQLRDLLLSATNGDVRVHGDIQSLDTSTVNGDVLLTLSGDELIQVTASSVQGDVKVSLPEELSLEVEAKTTLGKIESRLSGTETPQANKGKHQSYVFNRMGTTEICRVKLQTTSGNILLKDTE